MAALHPKSQRLSFPSPSAGILKCGLTTCSMKEGRTLGTCGGSKGT